jgi:hypothetical protein
MPRVLLRGRMGVSGVGRRGDLERGSSARLEGLVVCHSAFDLHADGLCHPASCDDCPLELQSVGQRVLAGGGRGGAGAGARCCWSGCVECGSQERVHVRYTLSVSSPESQQSERCEPLSLLRLTADSDSDSLFSTSDCSVRVCVRTEYAAQIPCRPLHREAPAPSAASPLDRDRDAEQCAATAGHDARQRGQSRVRSDARSLCRSRSLCRRRQQVREPVDDRCRPHDRQARIQGESLSRSRA